MPAINFERAFKSRKARIALIALAMWGFLSVVGNLDTAKSLASSDHWFWRVMYWALFWNGSHTMLIGTAIVLLYLSLEQAQHMVNPAGLAQQPTEEIALAYKGIRLVKVASGEGSLTYSEVVEDGKDIGIVFTVRREATGTYQPYQALCRARLEYFVADTIFTSVNDAPWLNEHYNYVMLKTGDVGELLIALTRRPADPWIALDDQRSEPGKYLGYLPRELPPQRYDVLIELIAQGGYLVEKHRVSLELRAHGVASWNYVGKLA